MHDTNLFRTSPLLAMLLAACGGGTSNSAGTTNTVTTPVRTTTSTTTTTTITDIASTTGSFTLTSTAVTEGGTLPAAFTCDGARSTPPLSWSNAPSDTKSFALLMTTLSRDGTKWNWVLYNIPSTVTRLVLNTSGVGTLGTADDGAGNAFAPPCSQGVGAFTYSFTVYALSAAPSLSTTASQNTGPVVAAAIRTLTLGSASLNISYTRSTGTAGSSTATNCALIQASTAAYAANVAVDCTASDYGKVASTGLPAHAMMNGITASNLQVPLTQNFQGSNAWKIPLSPAIAATPTPVTDGPIGIAINGVPIFNPCKQGGCNAAAGGGDTKVLGELDSCNGHAGRADDYHYHAAPTCLMADQAASYWNTNPVGWALDGFAIFGYNNADGSLATRDSICGGNTTAVSNAPAGYSYHVTDTAPYVTACLRGIPSPDLLGQGGKYTPLRQSPVTPFAVSGMGLTTDASDGYQVLQFTSARSFTSTATGSDSYPNTAGSYRIRYKALTGTALGTALALPTNKAKTACWNFQFTTISGATSQPTLSYCR